MTGTAGEKLKGIRAEAPDIMMTENFALDAFRNSAVRRSTPKQRAKEKRRDCGRSWGIKIRAQPRSPSKSVCTRRPNQIHI